MLTVIGSLRYAGVGVDTIKARLTRITPVLIAVATIAGCSAFGPGRIAPDRFDYNEAIARSGNEQMLLNLVRLRFQDVPLFLVVGSVLTQYVYSGNAGVNASVGTAAGAAADSAGLSAGVLYIERPTITYNPLSGDDFSRQLLAPIRPDLIFSLIQSGWRADQLLAISLQRINGAVNVPVDGLPDNDGPAARARFERVLQLTVRLGRRGAIEMQAEPGDNGHTRYLVFEETDDPHTRAMIAEYKHLLKLDPARSIFRVTEQLTRREPDQITIRVRSILTLMRFLATGVEVPDALGTNGQSQPHTAATTATGAVRSPLTIHSGTNYPNDAFAAVRYHGHWFYIENRDVDSKRAFGLLTYLFQLQSPKAPTQGPVLTVPTG